MDMTRLKDVWLRFRSSNAFLYTLCGFLVVWFTVRWFIPFDADLTLINLLLSIEAAVATCMILDLQFRALYSDRSTLQHIMSVVDQLKEHGDLLKSHAHTLAEVLDEVQEDSAEKSTD